MISRTNEVIQSGNFSCGGMAQALRWGGAGAAGVHHLGLHLQGGRDKVRAPCLPYSSSAAGAEPASASSAFPCRPPS
jgi:hypothetical protein